MLERVPIFRFQMATVFSTHFRYVLKEGKLFEKLILAEIIIVIFAERDTFLKRGACLWLGPMWLNWGYSFSSNCL